MPIVYHKEFETGWIALWRITESAEQLESMVCTEDVVRSREFASVSRKCEWLAWRALLARTIEGATVGYDNLGAPILTCGDGYIGVSHEKEFAAVIYSKEERCAIDIENMNRDFNRVARRYVTDDELMLSISAEPLFNAAIWCAKEVLYKSAGKLGLDLLNDIHITAVDFDRAQIQGHVRDGESMDLSMFTYENRLIVYTLLK